ncbi:hypothetical protein ACLB2K_073741 [Fragaria x ananassa]
MAPVHLIAESVQEFRAKMLGLKPLDSATKFSLKLFTDATVALHLFEQAISIADLRLPDDAGFELYAPNHFSRQLSFQQEIPFPLFESVNMYTSWRLRRKWKKQTDDPHFQPKFAQFKVKDEENIPYPCQPSSSQTPHKRRRKEAQDPEDEPEIPLVRRRRNATLTNEDVTILDHDPDEDEHITLNEFLHNLLPVCHATPIATMDTSGNGVPFGPVEETDRNSGAEASNIPKEEDMVPQQNETVVEGALILLVNAFSPYHDNVSPVPPPILVSEDITASHIEYDEPRATVAAEETYMGENLAPQATEVSETIATLRSCANASEIKYLEDLEFHLDLILDLQDNLQHKEQVASECLHKQTTLEEKFRSEKEQFGSQHSCILTGIDAEIRKMAILTLDSCQGVHRRIMGNTNDVFRFGMISWRRRCHIYASANQGFVLLQTKTLAASLDKKTKQY